MEDKVTRLAGVKEGDKLCRMSWDLPIEPASVRIVTVQKVTPAQVMTAARWYWKADGTDVGNRWQWARIATTEDLEGARAEIMADQKRADQYSMMLDIMDQLNRRNRINGWRRRGANIPDHVVAAMEGLKESLDQWAADDAAWAV